MRLTHTQESMAAAIEDQWLAAAMETGPADRAAAEEGVREAYRLASAEPPERIYWFGSPRAAAAAAALLSGPVDPIPEAPGTTSPPPAVAPSGAAAPQAGAGPGSSAVPPAGAELGLGAASLAGAGPGLGADSEAVRPPVGAGPGQEIPEWFAEAQAELRRQGWTPGARAGRSMRGLVRTAPWAAARKAALVALGADGWAQLSAAAGRRSWPLVMDMVAGRLRSRLSEDLAAELPAAGPAVLDAVYGQHDGAWLSTFEAAARVCPEADLMTNLAGLARVARHSGWWWAFERVAVLSERPVTLARDNVGRLHRGEGPAMEFTDGYGLWAWRGMPIPSDLAAELPSLTVDRVRRETNAEIRRVMLEHFGYERYLSEAGATQINSDETGTLWLLHLPGDEPLVMVEVINSTPEPDGTSRVYWLRVPPQTRSAREGVAWTFGLTEQEYQPLIQT
ncbi:hypothetical protein GCM10010112_19700 [Actinoplanes lobatus]|uniref:DUF6745 domain-containing protein n=1 Tax=Actinoplanes lobatus TaxID=113568 RepID=A0A7W7HPC7_9ACTN|nr:hypothetical protein [Actinoplanes lobatus]MBB4754227.1 hypothetical protein [Actinoplanes lobatus]GGN61966.1 hypothetical protein GCM10010112_19700 [Actinoplanes lobatus]GIE44896.1 hypothetical protein Alo02nite_77940 [Actinoplanes lobatus]